MRTKHRAVERCMIFRLRIDSGVAGAWKLRSWSAAQIGRHHSLRRLLAPPTQLL